MLNVAIIPARSGSKGITKKNLRKINGKSLVQRAIESAKIHNIHKIIVSTDSIPIKKEALKFGAQVPFIRPIKYSDDYASSEDVLKHAILEYEKILKRKISYIVFLEPTSPFRTKNHVNEAVKRIKNSNFNSVISICQQKRKPENIFIKSSVLKRYIIEPKNKFIRRQDMTNLFRLNSAIYVIKRDVFLKNNNFVADPVGWIEMNEIESINIDTLTDLRIARILSKEIE